MDPIEIEGPDGAVNEFPAGTPDDVIEKAMRAQYGGPEAAPEQQPEQKGSMVDDFVRGVDRIAGTQFSGSKQRPVSAAEYGTEAENVVRSMTAPLGGDYLAAAGSAVAGKGYNPDEQRARREELADRNAGSKTAAVAGELLGAGGVAKVLAPAAGGVLAQGAATGAITAANESGGDLAETVKGAAFGAAGGKVVQKLGEAFSPLAALAKRLKTDAQTLGTEFRTLEAALGRKPTMVELMSENQTKAMTKLAEGRGGRTMETFQDAQRADLAARPGRMVDEVTRGQSTTGGAEMRAARDDAMDLTMQQIRGNQGVISPRDAQRLLHPDVARSLDDAAAAKLYAAVNGNHPVFVTVGDMDTIRRTLGRAVEAARRDGANFDALNRARATARLVGERIEPRYRGALAEYEGRSAMAEGAETGAKIRSASAGDLEAAAARLDAPGQQGVRTGARQAISEAAADSERGAIRTAQELGEPGMQRKLAATVGPAEADRLATVGAGEARGAENFANITRKGVDDVIDPTDVKKIATLAATAAMKTKSPGVLSAGFEAVAKAIKPLGMAPGVGRRIAELATSPDGVERVIDFLRKSNVSAPAQRLVLTTLRKAMTDANMPPKAQETIVAEISKLANYQGRGSVTSALPAVGRAAGVTFGSE